jgi:hypothetical protein
MKMSNIFIISLAFLSVMFNFVFGMRKTRQVSFNIKYLLNLDSKGKFCFILHSTVPVEHIFEFRGLLPIRSL